MPPPKNPALSPAAYEVMDDEARIDLLVEHLEELTQQLCWVDDDMERYGICAICSNDGGTDFPHDCCERDL